jgi:large subunit ribosomal protein L30
MAKILVKQVKSQIKCPATQKRTLEALGLRKLGQVVAHENTATILGMVNKVKHLVSVEEAK